MAAGTHWTERRLENQIWQWASRWQFRKIKQVPWQTVGPQVEFIELWVLFVMHQMPIQRPRREQWALGRWSTADHPLLGLEEDQAVLPIMRGGPCSCWHYTWCKTILPKEISTARQRMTIGRHRTSSPWWCGCFDVEKLSCVDCIDGVK